MTGLKTLYNNDKELLSPHNAVALLLIGSIIDSVSTVIGHSVVSGIEEWNVVILIVGGLVPFPVAVFLIKVSALAIIGFLAFILWSKGGPWKLGVIIPGILWMTIGIANLVTILATV